MQKEGKPYFFNVNNASLRTVTFNPKDRYLFASGSCDGTVSLYTALRNQHLSSYNVIDGLLLADWNFNNLFDFKIITASLSKVVNGIRFTSDGTKILVSTTAKRLAVIDIEHGEQIQGYDNCTFNGRDRAAIAVDPTSSYYVATTCPNGR
jgi:WD40 repeat protein